MMELELKDGKTNNTLTQMRTLKNEYGESII